MQAISGSRSDRPPVPVWEVQARQESFGVRFGLRANRRELLDAAAQFLPPVRSSTYALDPQDRVYSLVTSSADDSRENLHHLYVGSRLRSSSTDPADLFDYLEGDLQIHVGEMSRFVFIHAGVVAWNGIGIILPGRSYYGKSTLVTALLRAGATYCSDEFAILDEQGNLYPYPRRLSLREKGQPRAIRRSAESLGGRTETTPLRPGLVLITRYRSGKSWTPRRVQPSDAVLELARHSLSIRRQPEQVLNILGRLVGQAVVLQSDRGEADETAARVLQSSLLQ